MPAPKTTVNTKNFKEIHRYLSRALDEERLFSKDSQHREEALKSFTHLKLPPDTGTILERKDFFKELQSWMDSYVPEDMRKKCLSALRWNRAKQNHRSKTIRLNHNVYVLLRQYARTRHLTIQQAIFEAVLPYVHINPDTMPVGQEKKTIKEDESKKPVFKVTVF